MSKGVVIFSGYNQRAVIAFLRTLTEHAVPFSIVASSDQDTIFLTKYADKVAYTRSRVELDLNDVTAAIEQCKKYLGISSVMIAPSTEALNRFVLKFRKQLGKLGCFSPLVNQDLYIEISDKKSFGVLCKNKGITIPDEFASVVDAIIPFVAKPKHYLSSKGEALSPVLVMNQSEKLEFTQTYNQDDFYYQTFVGGQSHYLLYYIFLDGAINKISQTNFVQQPKGKSIIAATTADIHTDQRAKIYDSLLRDLGFTGLVMIEIKEANGKFYMIEANPRFWGPSQLFVDAGVNLFLGLLYDHGFIDGKPKIPGGTKPARYYWHGGVVESINSSGKLVFYSDTKSDFIHNMQQWLAADIYNRVDTVELFSKEAGDYDTTTEACAALLNEQ